MNASSYCDFNEFGGLVMSHERVNDRRWLIAVMGTCLQVCLGTVYAWSYFQKPLVAQYGWANTKVAWAFSLAIFSLGCAAAWGGMKLPKYGPRLLAVTGGALFGLGNMLAALALHIKSLPLLYVGYGLIGGVGLGLGYVTPVATVAKWFPGKKGFVTGMVIMGFGLGALLMSKVIAPLLMTYFNGNLVEVFAVMGAGLAVAAMLFGSFLTNPPAGAVSQPQGPNAAPVTSQSSVQRELAGSGGIATWRFLVMWLVFFCNIMAGISIISFQSPLMQDLWHKIDPSLNAAALAAYGATLIAISSLFNGIGRLFWGGLSDRLGRVQTFRVMIGTQVVAFGLLMLTGNPWIFGALICYILLCYGGGFGTMPSFVHDVFGAKRMPVVYGTILTAWSAAGVAGPQMVAYLKDHFSEQASRYAFGISAGILTLGLVLALLLSNRPLSKAD